MNNFYLPTSLTDTYTLANGKSYKGKFENGQIVIGEGNIIDLTPDE